MNAPESNEMVQQGAAAGPAFAPLAPRATAGGSAAGGTEWVTRHRWDRIAA